VLLLQLLLLLRYHLTLTFAGHVPFLIATMLIFTSSLLLLMYHRNLGSTEFVWAIFSAPLLPTILTTLQKIL
jgi:hypothetical protein